MEMTVGSPLDVDYARKPCLPTRTACRTRIRLTVTNDGATISHADAERVFEPFWRGDTARTVERGHCGLGLPLVRRLVTVLGGPVSVSVKGGKFTVLVVLPASSF